MIRRQILVICLAVVLMPVSLAAQTPGADATPAPSASASTDAPEHPAIVYGEVKFKTDPAYADLGSAGPYYPERAQRMGIRGYAVLGCHIADNLNLSDCTVLVEKPMNVGFGLAALMMARRSWMTAARPDAEQPHTTDGWVPIVVRF
jgi:TonB family protein